MASNFVQVPDGYEIRPLKLRHLRWAAAIVAQTMAFDSPIFTKMFPSDQAQLDYDIYHAIKPSSKHCIKSGHSLGVFVKDWKPRYPESEERGTEEGDTENTDTDNEDTDKGSEKGAALCWNFADPSATREELLDQMDFPLVAIAMHKDAAVPMPKHPDGHKSYGEVMGEAHLTVNKVLQHLDEPQQGDPTTPILKGQVLKNSGRHTRRDHGRKGLSRALAHGAMKTMADKGYRRIVIQTMNEAVNRVWENPPAPWKAIMRSAFKTTAERDPRTGEEIDSGVFNGADVVCKRIWVV
jgi:hypothetical protein